MTRRGFTLLETILAALVGALVLSACVALFGLLDRSDRRLGARFEDAMAMERLRSAVSRAMDTLVMSSDQPAPGAGAPDAQATAHQPPRFVLEPDLSPALTGLIRKARIAGDGPTAAPQRFEVVLARSPVPPRAGREEAPVHGRRAVRGVFELRPDRRKARDHGSYAVKGDEAGWTLWWRPLQTPTGPTTGAPAGNSTDTRWIEPAEDPAATEIISGLERCQWTAYQGRQKKTSYSATWAIPRADDGPDGLRGGLPAYVELSVRTTAGLSGNWMFEVGWSNSPEIVEDPLAPATGADGGDKAGNGAGGTGTPGTTINNGKATTPNVDRVPAQRITPAGNRPAN